MNACINKHLTRRLLHSIRVYHSFSCNDRICPLFRTDADKYPLSPPPRLSSPPRRNKVRSASREKRKCLARCGSGQPSSLDALISRDNDPTSMERVVARFAARKTIRSAPRWRHAIQRMERLARDRGGEIEYAR